MEYPYFVVDNLLDGATSVTENQTETSGYTIDKVYDNLHHTSFKVATASYPVTITVTPSAHRKINCVIIDSKYSDTSGYYQVSVNGSSVVNTQTTQDVVNGTIILTFTEVVALSSSTVTISLYGNATSVELRHVWVGYYRTLPNANYEFDPIQDVQVFRKQDNEDGQIINNSAKYNHKILEATFSNVSPTDFAKLDYLRTNSFYTATPFWFFVRPTTDPTVGFMYHWDTDSYARPFQNGNYRGFQIKAKANYTASRSPDRAPFAFTKMLALNGSDHIGSCTSFSCGTTHTIEFWIDPRAMASARIIGTSTTVSDLVFSTTTNFRYKSTDSANFTITALTAGVKNHILVTRDAQTVKLYINGVQTGGTQTLAANNNFNVDTLSAAAVGAVYLAHLRIYKWVLNSTQIAAQYNSGAGADRLANGLYAAWEFDESGTNSLTTNEDNQEGTANRDLTIAGTAPIRKNWPFRLTKCIDFNGSSEYCTVTLFNIGTVHTIEFWIDSDDTSATILGKNDSTSSVLLTSPTNLRYTAGSQAVNFTISAMSLGTKKHYLITRTGTAVVLYVNGVATGGAQTLGASSNFEINQVGLVGTIYLDGKLGHLRAYDFVTDATQIANQYNYGIGNDAIETGQYFVWEMDDTGGTSTTEDNQEGTSARDLTLIDTPTRTSW